MAKKKLSAKEIIEKVLKDRLDNVEASVSVTPSLDEDGDRILLVTVVFEGDSKRLDPRETSGLARRVLPKLREIEEKGFPIFSFVAKSELRKLNPEAG